jgi:hypothetical protein
MGVEEGPLTGLSLALTLSDEGPELGDALGETSETKDGPLLAD